MIDGNTYFLFFIASLVFCLVPGPDIIYLVARTLGQGKSAGVWAALGINVGAYVHLMAAVLGITALIAASSVWFGIIKWVGAAYLFILGVNALRSAATARSISSHKLEKSSFWQGFYIDVLNPKVAMFYLAFFPQFIDPQLDVTTQLMILGVSLNLIGVMTNLLVVYMVVQVRNVVQKNSFLNRLLMRMMGVVFIGLGVRLATEEIT